jgi:hypothetical protein
MGNKPKLYDGYTVRNGEVTFCTYSALHTMQVGKHLKVDQDKVIEYEGMCETYRRNFMEIGWLRLHTPVGQHQETLGTNFLSVPLEHRARVAGMLKGGTLVKLDKPKTFRILETGEDITFEQLLCGGELFDLIEAGRQNREKLDSGAITKEEWERQTQAINQWEKTKFHIECWEIAGMFVEE